MLIYNYKETTKEYIDNEEACIDIEETKVQGKTIYLIPANSTIKKPPETDDFEVAIFNENTNNWQKLADFRNQYITDASMQPYKYDRIGDLPEGFIYITEEQAQKIQNDKLYYIIDDNQLIVNPNYEQELANARQQDFKSKFFEIKNFGWYRREPKGYSSAVESINSAYNSFTEMQKLGLAENFPANTLIFYQQPDFTKPEQCTEEWLVAHQMLNQEMTPQQFGQFYIGFIQAWNTQEHEQSEAD